jgi:non-specific serine/threonine protein kinase
MAPEALRGELVDGRVDIWALGVMLYEMASATRPFTGSTPFDICGKILHAEPAPLPGRVPAGLEAVIARCLAKQPSDRFPNAGEVRLALEAVQTGAQTATTSSVVARPAHAGRGTLLVLPFTNLAADPESDYFANGLTDEIIADLSNVRHLRVISSTSSMQFKDTTLTVTELAKQLGVEHVLEGSVRRMGDALRVTAKLVEAATDSPIWGNKYSGSLKDVFAIQETLSRSIVDALRVVLSSREEQQLKEHPIPDVRAYEWYLRARQEMLRFTKESLDRVIECLEQSEAIAGDNALILATKGEAYWQYVNSGISGDVSYLDKADACAERALEIEPRSPHGRRVSALVRVHRGDMPGAFRQLRLALELAPNDPDCLLWGSIVAGVSGQMALADAWADRLVAVDPVTPFYQLVPGTMRWLSGDYERAWALWSERPGAVMENPLMRLVYGHLAVVTGRTDEGRRILEDLARAEPANPFGQLAVIYQAAFDGDAARALSGLTPDLIATLESDPQYCWFIAQCHALAGDVDGGIRWTDVAVSRGFINHDVLARFDPFLANLRGDPRYESLMRDVKKKRDAIAS